MGVKDLWKILGPFCERKPLYELQGKTIAIDLSCWVCEAQNISEYQVQPRMYLRNLYFRTCYLLLLGVNPVFVLEGKAPTLKYDTIAARNAIQFKGARPRNDTDKKVGKDRSRFNFTLKQCEEMLEHMGLACIKGNGEAEAMCAYLNEEGLVEACISQDSDCFAYGAKKVYRNFSISQQGAHSASGGCVDVYDIEKLIQTNSFGRYKIIALALLCGSDYCPGVFGIGKDSALKLFDKVSDDDILNRLRSWRKDTAFYIDLNRKINDKNTCTSCGHSGKIQSHAKNGCNSCYTTSSCDSSKYKDERVAIKNELNIREKALEDPDFPNEKLINEFLVRKDNVSELNLKWKRPDMVNFVKFTTKYLQWEEIYAFEKFLPVLTRWQLVNYEFAQKITKTEKTKGILHPNYIKKIRKPKGIASYEIIWADKENHLIGLIPQEQREGVPTEKLLTTIEPQNLVETAYPDLVNSFIESKTKPKVTTKRKQKSSIKNLQSELQNTSISEPKAKTKKQANKKKTNKDTVGELENSFSEMKIQTEYKPKTKRNAVKKKTNKDAINELESSFSEMKIQTEYKQKTLDSFVKKVLIDNYEKSKNLNDEDVEQEYRVVESVKNNSVIGFNCDLSNFGDESDSDLSSIIDGIITRDPPKYIENNLQQFNGETSFFMTDITENDLFEQTIGNDFEYDDEDTENYVDNVTNRQQTNCKALDSLNKTSSDDSFTEVYVPLIERIRNK